MHLFNHNGTATRDPRLRGLSASLGLLLAGSLPFAAQAQSGPCQAESLFRSGFDDTSSLQISGVVAADGAVGIVTLEGLASGPVQVEVDASGTYSFALPDDDTHAMLRLAYQSLEPRTDIELFSLPGTLFAIDQAAGTGLTTPSHVQDLALDGLSTARAIGVIEALTGEPVDDCELQAAWASLDPVQTIERAAVVKLIVEDDSVSLPAAPLGTAPITTADLLEDTSAYASFVSDLDTTQPGLLDATEALYGANFCSLADAGRIWQESYNRPMAMLNALGAEIDFDGMGAGNGIWFEGSDTFNVACVMGGLEFTFLGGTRMTDTMQYRDIGGVPQLVRVVTTVESERWERIDPGLVRVDISIERQVRYDYPDTPALPTDFATQTTTATVVLETAGTELTTVNLENRDWLLLALDSSGDNNLPSSNMMHLLAGGSGSERGGGALSWTADGDTLTVTLADGRVVRQTRLRQEGEAIDTLATLSVPGGATRAFMKMMIADDPSVVLTAPDVPLRYIQRGDIGPLRFGFDLFAGGLGENFGPGGFLAPVGWVLDAGTIVIRRCYSETLPGWVALDREPFDDECLAYQRRSWEPLDLGPDRLYVFEHLRIWSSDPFDTLPTYDQPRPMFYVTQPLPAP